MFISHIVDLVISSAGISESFTFHACVKYKRQTLSVRNRSGINSLVSAVQLKWAAFKIMEFELLFANPSTNSIEVVTEDSQLWLFNNQTLNFTVKSCCTGFSDYANKKQAALHVAGLPFVDPSLILTDDAVFPLSTNSTIVDAAKQTQLELMKRAKAIDLDEACEYTKREFISVLLIAAICICNASERLISMICEKTVVGKHGRGPIDYALLFKRIFVLLTEAKNTDLEGGQSQNIVQQESCRESLANAFVPLQCVGETRKRKFHEIFDVVRTIPTFGIVTTGRQWRFTKVDHSREKTRVTKSATLDLLLDPTSDPAQVNTQLQNIEAILRRIVGVLEYQMEQVNSHTQVKQLLEGTDAKEVGRIENLFWKLAEAMDNDEEAARVEDGE